MKILVTGAVGGVGRTAVHVAKKHGAQVWAGVRAKQRTEAETLGADGIVAIDDEDEIAELKNLDAIADTVGGETITKLLPAMKKSGVVASVLGKPKGADEAGVRVAEIYAQPDSSRLRELAEDLLRGEFFIPIARTFRLSEIREAQQFAQDANPGGKVIVLP
jgi:NADPH:quinone reductase-like Zn-dependent oxidoreductase